MTQLQCTSKVQHQTGPGGFGNSYDKGNRLFYGPVPSNKLGLSAPEDLNDKVTLSVETAAVGDNIQYKILISNYDTVERSGRLAWSGMDEHHHIDDIPQFLFTVKAQPDNAVQGCVHLPKANFELALTFQAF